MTELIEPLPWWRNNIESMSIIASNVALTLTSRGLVSAFQEVVEKALRFAQRVLFDAQH